MRETGKSLRARIRRSSELRLNQHHTARPSVDFDHSIAVAGLCSFGECVAYYRSPKLRGTKMLVEIMLPDLHRERQKHERAHQACHEA